MSVGRVYMRLTKIFRSARRTVNIVSYEQADGRSPSEQGGVDNRERKGMYPTIERKAMRLVLIAFVVFFSPSRFIALFISHCWACLHFLDECG